MKTLLVLIAAGVLASACSVTGLKRSSGEQLLSRYEPYVGEPIHSFSALRQDSWQPVSRTQLVLWTGLNDAYLLTIGNNCPSLMFTNRVLVTTSASSISTLDTVIVGANRCPIQQIQPIDVKRMRADRNA